MDELTKFANEIILDPMAHLNTYQARVAFAKSYLTLQKRVEELEMNIKEAVKEIEDSMQSADWEVASVYDGALLILKNHGLVEDK